MCERIMKENDYIRRAVEENQQHQTRDKKKIRHIQCIGINKY